jgi:uncharacterized protein YndB with AHSA1/START domain
MRLSAERSIPRPAAEVFEFLADAANNPRWQKGMRRCEWTTPPPTGIGSVYEQEAKFAGRSIISRFEVTTFEPGRSITIETVESTFPISVTRTVEPTSDGCRVTAAISGGPGGVFLVLAPLLRWMAQRSVDADYDRLVEQLSR